MKSIDELRDRELELERQLEKVREQRAKLQQKSPVVPRESARPLREQLLDALQEAGAPLNSLLIASVFRPLSGREVPSTRFGTLSADEQKSFDSGRPKPVYLCHGLTHDQGLAMKRFWARSDWPLEERIVGPMTGRVLFLRGAAWVIALAKEADSRAVEPDKLRFVAADQARSAGLSVRRGEFPYDEWLSAIGLQLKRILAGDQDLRQIAAAKLGAHLTDRQLLFGATPPLTSLPGSSKQWSSVGT